MANYLKLPTNKEKEYSKDMKINKNKKHAKTKQKNAKKGIKSKIIVMFELMHTKGIRYSTLLLLKFIQNEKSKIIFFLLCISAPFIIAAQHNSNEKKDSYVHRY
jgi:hypothetical protein